MKFLLVSDSTGFALTDVYYGYQHAFKQLDIPFECFPFHHFRGILSDEICYHVVHSTALLKNKEFTHVLFIGGLNIPTFLIESYYHVKTIVASTEDPHTSSPMIDRLDNIDYYFTNERSIANSGKFKNVYYCPTAGSSFHCNKIPRDTLDSKYLSDILFLGAMYPNRAQLLESIIPLVKEHNLTFKVCGHIGYLPKKSPLWEYVTENKTIPHEETVYYYNGAKTVINILRDISWNPRQPNKRNPFNRYKFKAESLNPRAYEVPMCGAFMLLEDTREEAKDVFNNDEVAFFSDPKSLNDQIKKYLIDSPESAREEMALKAFKKVSLNHSYVQRLQKILNILQKDTPQ